MLLTLVSRCAKLEADGLVASEGLRKVCVTPLARRALEWS